MSRSGLLNLALLCMPAVWGQEPAQPAKPAAPAKSAEAAKPEPPEAIPSIFESWKIQLDIGARNFDLYGDRPGKFFESRDIIRGAYVRNLDLHFHSADSPYMFFLRGSDVRELDETIQSDLWRVGKFRTTFLWDRLPRFYGEGTSLFQSDSRGNLVVSPAIRGAFQTAVDGQPPQLVPPALYPLVRNELSLAPVSDVRVKRDQVSLRQSIRFGSLELHGQWRSIFSRGTRPKGIGTFARQNIGPAGDGLWESIGVEIPEPVRHRTDQLTLGALTSGKKWRLGFDYRLSFFRNDITTLTYENPFRVTDAAGNPPGSAVGRNRFVRQQNALAPNTDYHSITVYGGFDLPRDTQVRALFSWGRSSQNDPFVPYTMNTALVGTAPGLANNLPAGSSVLNVSSLPQTSLNGRVRTLNYDGALVSRPWKNMNFRVQYRAEDMKNQSPRIVFPGQPRFGDSHWVTNVDYYGLPIENFPTSYVRQDAIASWEWDVMPSLTWKAEYQYETQKNIFRDAPHLNEHSVGGRIDYKIASKYAFKADYKYSDRKPDRYLIQPLTFNPTLNGWEVVRSPTEQYPQFIRGVPLEFNQLRRFDMTGRNRHDGNAALEFRLGDKVTFSPSAHYLRNNYTKGFYGLTFDEMVSADSEVTFTAGERTFLFLNYSLQLDRYHMLGMGNLITGAVVNGSPCCAQYPIANTWNRSSRSKLNYVQAGLNWASSGEKTAIDLNYGFSFARDQIHASNPYTIRADSPYTAGAYNYPDTKNGFREVFLTLTRKLRPGLEVGLQYKFNSYQLDDFYLNALQAYPFGPVTSGGLVSNLPRQLLLNARFTTYHAHQESFFVRYNF
ncbi:MAG: MtrB/PioB family outer membrane beta-barrel protein [Acidobacteria bacterium]|nr:MtrB/PioB family outer membrane beta-barrel protein [Acidobacteriota bacterium]